ncbi:hypothetical protein U0070_027360, partial [Myodes glareolus]
RANPSQNRRTPLLAKPKPRPRPHKRAPPRARRSLCSGGNGRGGASARTRPLPGPASSSHFGSRRDRGGSGGGRGATAAGAAPAVLCSSAAAWPALGDFPKTMATPRGRSKRRGAFEVSSDSLPLRSSGRQVLQLCPQGWADVE